MTEAGQLLLVLTLATPLAAVALVPAVRQPLYLLPWAAVPGLATALLAVPGTTVELSMLMLGLHVQLDRIGAIFLGFGSLLWCFAGAYACGYLAAADRASSFSVFWLLTLAGTLGTFIAADAATFYAAFSMMSLATYGLVVHDRTENARRAGRIYIVLAVLGEAALLAAFILAASDADSVLFADMGAALAASQWSNYILAGLLIGFGIKAGLVPLHVWLPLAHPEAPTPASAVLSGAIVKAAIIGLIRLFPADDAAPAWSELLIVLGLVTAYFGIAIGLTQTDAKAILAYSTLSQMGIIVTILASGLGAQDTAHAFNVVALYASHHGLAKGALFLAVGIVATCGRPAFRPVIVITALTALAIAGLPLSGGALAKLAAKDVLGEGSTGVLVTWSAAGTALLMLRFIYVLAQKGGTSAATPIWGLVLPWAGLVIAALAVPWIMFSRLSGNPAAYALSATGIQSALWPILLALLVALIAMWRGSATGLAVPQGDIVVLAETLARGVNQGARQLRAHLPAPRLTSVSISLDRVKTAERMLQQWSVSGATLVIVALLIAAVLAS